jgi:hypothetical protein
MVWAMSVSCYLAISYLSGSVLEGVGGLLHGGKWWDLTSTWVYMESDNAIQ